MKAITRDRYGSPDILRLDEVGKPTPKDDEVLLRVHASSVNPADWFYLTGTPFPLRLQAGLFRPHQRIPGLDVAGRVEAVGRNVTRLKVGDEVFGESDGGGAYAEYATVPADRLALKPANLDFARAAAVPIAGITALQALRDHGHLTRGQRVLVIGASGGVGTFAVQIGKALGAHVTGVCSTRNVDLVRRLGADEVIDYTQADYTQSPSKYDGTRSRVWPRSKKSPDFGHLQGDAWRPRQSEIVN